ncbi:MAG: TraR/DksA C4-type zinc finger protein [Desulfobacteraceae bacterium]
MDTRTINDFKQLLTNRLEELQSQADQTISELVKQNVREIEHLDRAWQHADQTFKLNIRTRENRLINKIRNALERIEEGSYGICELCGQNISIKRLKARPVTTKCLQCKEEEEKLESVTG